MSNNADAALPARAGGALNDDLYISAQQSQEVHKPLGGKFGQPALEQARDLWLVNLQNAGGSSLGNAAGANRFGDANGEIGFGEALFWFRQADVGEYIAAAFLYVDVSMHWLIPLSNDPTLGRVLPRPAAISTVQITQAVTRRYRFHYNGRAHVIRETDFIALGM
jgi:hypothetical protein